MEIKVFYIAVKRRNVLLSKINSTKWCISGSRLSVTFFYRPYQEKPSVIRNMPEVHGPQKLNVHRSEVCQVCRDIFLTLFTSHLSFGL